MRDVLVALCGLTPQVVTETLWALGRQTPPIHPSEIWILTTEAGRQACLTTLLGSRGALARYAREYRLGTKPRCGPEQILLLRTQDGAPLEDVRSARDNHTVADQIAEALRRQTERPGIRLHCSVAGGRKTMGILLAGALQLYGRAEDRLYHVLVWPLDFESHPDFFYPPRRPRKLQSKEGSVLDTRNTRVELAEVPYVRLRDHLLSGAFTGTMAFSDLVARAQKELRLLAVPEPIRLDPSRNRVHIGEFAIALRPAQMRLYTAFARIKAEHCAEPTRKTCEGCTACYLEISQRTWPEVHVRLQQLSGQNLLSPQHQRGETKEIAVERFRSLWSKTNKALEKALGSERIARRYRIESVRESGGMRYGLAVSKELLKEAAEQERPSRLRA